MESSHLWDWPPGGAHGGRTELSVRWSVGKWVHSAVMAAPIEQAYALAHPLGIGPRGVFIAMTIAFSSLAVVSAVVFRRGRWKAKKV